LKRTVAIDHARDYTGAVTETAELQTESPTEQNLKPKSSQVWLCLVLIGAAVIVAYSNSLGGAFIFDDRDEILNNPSIRTLAPPWASMFNPRNVGRPLVGLSLAINYAIGGYNVWSYHLFNLLVHLIAGLTLFGVVRRTLTSPRLREPWSDKATGLALGVALLWIVHPLCTQAVSYTIQRAESMMGLFYLLTLYCAIRAGEGQRAALWSGASIASCFAGMLSKQVMITAPLVVLAWDFLFLAPPWQTVRKRLPLYFGLATGWVLLGVTMAFAPMSKSAGFGIESFTPLEYLMTQCGVIAHYLRLALWPSPLCFDYAWPKATSVGDVWFGALVVVGLFAATCWALFSRRPIAFPGVWFFLTLALSSSFIPLDDAAFEYRMYLPLAAVVVIAVVAGHLALQKLVGRSSDQTSQFRHKGSVVVACLVILLAGVTMQRNELYASELTMWSDVVSKRPDNARAHADLAYALAAEGRHDEALAHLERSCELSPSNAATRYSLGMGLFLHGDAARAREHLEQAVILKPDGVEPHVALGRLLLFQGRHDDAGEHFQSALALNRDYAPAHLGLGRAFEGKGKIDEAIGQYRETLKRAGDWPEALCQLALTLSTRPESAPAAKEEAVHLAKQAVSVTEGMDPGPLDILAAVYAAAGRFAEASQAAGAAMRLARSGGNDSQVRDLDRRVRAYAEGKAPMPPTAIEWR
jgi:tetratricopeptide (TPR) repeat protein